MSRLAKYSLLTPSSFPICIVSLRWIWLKPTTKTPQNSYSDPDTGPTLSLLWIWTHPPPMQQLTTRIEIERYKRIDAMVFIKTKQK